MFIYCFCRFCNFTSRSNIVDFYFIVINISIFTVFTIFPIKYNCSKSSIFPIYNPITRFWIYSDIRSIPFTTWITFYSLTTFVTFITRNTFIPLRAFITLWTRNIFWIIKFDYFIFISNFTIYRFTAFFIFISINFWCFYI